VRPPLHGHPSDDLTTLKKPLLLPILLSLGLVLQPFVVFRLLHCVDQQLVEIRDVFLLPRCQGFFLVLESEVIVQQQPTVTYRFVSTLNGA